MAQLDAVPVAPWTAAQTRAQLVAVAWLRWRIFLNSFRTKGKKRSTSGLVLITLIRIVAWTIVAAFCIGPIVASGALGYIAVAQHRPSLLGTLTWIVFSTGLFISINISPATLGFDLTPLIRFPIDFSQYLLVRLFFGLFAIPTVIANLALAAAAVGIGVADPALFPWAALVLGVFALHNVFFIRMVFAWVDRWMATRRAREIFGGIVVFVSLGFQLVATGNARHNVARFQALSHLLAQLHPILQVLPPSLAADAIVHHAALVPASANLIGLLAFALGSLAIFALRLRKEFRGENLSEANRRTVPKGRQGVSTEGSGAVGPLASTSACGVFGHAFRVPPTIAACLGKELIYLKRSGAQLYGLVTPLVLIFIFARRNGLFSNTPLLLPYAASYVLFGLLANLYNVLGADGPGFSLYLLAPIRMRDVMLSKNLVSGGVIAVEIVLACAAVSIVNGQIPPGAMLAATLSWAGFAVLLNMTVGNLRSLFAPRRFELGKARRAVTAKGSGFFSLGVLLVTVAVGIPVIYLCRRYNVLWLATPIFLGFAAAALAAYVTVLGRVDSILMSRREELSDALCKS